MEEAFVHDVLNPQYVDVFRFDKFSALQMILMSSLLDTDENMVINAPTGSGKTVLFELAIIRVIHGLKAAAMIYIAPTKAIVQERVRDWSATFKNFNVDVIELTGDVNTVNFEKLGSNNVIICTTPDKFEVSSRSLQGSFHSLLDKIKLLMIDEVHHIGEDSLSRGYKLEVLIIRMKLLQKQHVGQGFRIVACSATLQNVAEIGQWLECTAPNIHHFDSSFRPVPLDLNVLSFGNLNNPFLFDKVLDSRVIEILNKYSKAGRQTLIFCPSKANTEKLAKTIANSAARNSTNSNNNSMTRVNTSIASLNEVIQSGVAFHHSGLTPDDRDIVESLFNNGTIKTLVSTSTLAQGVNLPAYLVIVKGTSVWREGGYKALSRIEISQMIGRAGRRGKDDHGVAVIMTSNEHKSRYNSLNETEVIDSQIESHLIEIVGAEISLGIICSIEDCNNWLMESFFSVMLYKKSNSAVSSDKFINSLSENVVKELRDSKFITLSSANMIKENFPNILMTKYNLSYNTIKSIMVIEDNISMSGLLRVISGFKELLRVLKRSEKKLLGEVDKSHSVYKLENKKITTPQDKAFVLINAAMVKFEFASDYSLKIDTQETVEGLLRILHAIREMMINVRFNGKVLYKCLIIERACKSQIWVTDLRLLLAIKNSKLISRDLWDKLAKQSSHLYLSNLNINGIQASLYCNRTEAEQICSFFQICRKKIDITLSSSKSDTSGSTQYFDFRMSEDAPQSALEEELSNNFDIICYSKATNKLLAYRSVNLKHILSKPITIPLKSELSDLFICATGRYSSQDTFWSYSGESILQANLLENAGGPSPSTATSSSSEINPSSSAIAGGTSNSSSSLASLTGKRKKQTPIDQYMAPKNGSKKVNSIPSLSSQPSQVSIQLSQNQGHIRNQSPSSASLASLSFSNSNSTGSGEASSSLIKESNSSAPDLASRSAPPLSMLRTIQQGNMPVSSNYNQGHHRPTPLSSSKTSDTFSNSFNLDAFKYDDGSSKISSNYSSSSSGKNSTGVDGYQNQNFKENNINTDNDTNRNNAASSNGASKFNIAFF